MRFFVAKPVNPNPGFSVRRRRWSLPGVICPACGATWSNIGIAYPSVRLGASEGAEELANPRAAPLDEFERLRSKILPVLPPEAPLPPGTGFGPLVVESCGPYRHFVWPDPWTLLVGQEVLDVLRRARIAPLVATPIESARGEEGDPALLELQIGPGAYLARGEGIREVPPCHACGRQKFSKPKDRPLVLDRSSLPGNDMFRLHDLTTHIVVSEHFHDLAQEQGLTGTEFHEVEW